MASTRAGAHQTCRSSAGPSSEQDTNTCDGSQSSTQSHDLLVTPERTATPPPEKMRRVRHSPATAAHRATSPAGRHDDNAALLRLTPIIDNRSSSDNLGGWSSVHAIGQASPSRPAMSVPLHWTADGLPQYRRAIRRRGSALDEGPARLRAEVLGTVTRRGPTVVCQLATRPVSSRPAAVSPTAR